MLDARLKARVTCLLVGIDRLIARQLDVILHHPRFQQVESGWRGLHMLAAQSKGYRNVRIRMLDIDWHEIVRDLDRALEFDQSGLFQKVYTEEFDMPGGEPYGVMICDYLVSHTNANDMRAIQKLSDVAAAAFCPFLFPVHPNLLGLESFADMHAGTNIGAIFKNIPYIPWMKLRRLESCRFVGFVMPRILMRPLWQSAKLRNCSLTYSETVTHPAHYLWGNPCFALGCVLLREFEQVGWFAHIRGAPRDTLGGGVVVDLPDIILSQDDFMLAPLPPVEMVITDAKERELSENGFICLSQCWSTGCAAFYSYPALYEPKSDGRNGVDSDDRIASQMQNVLCASRFAHYIKVIMRDKVGSLLSAADCQHYLENWLLRYAIGNDDMDWSMQARYPLRGVQVEIIEDPWRVSHYICNVTLMPHYQADGLVSEIKLTTELTRVSAS